jgi:hypothetical protein
LYAIEFDPEYIRRGENEFASPAESATVPNARSAVHVSVNEPLNVLAVIESGLYSGNVITMGETAQPAASGATARGRAAADAERRPDSAKTATTIAALARMRRRQIRTGRR